MENSVKTVNCKRKQRKKPPKYEGFFAIRFQSQLAYCVLESLTGLEGWNLHGRNGNALAWVAWVHTRASRALGNLERSETGDGYGVALLQLLGYESNESVESRSSTALGDTGSICDCVDDILLGHRIKGKDVTQVEVYGRIALTQAEK